MRRFRHLSAYLAMFLGVASLVGFNSTSSLQASAASAPSYPQSPVLAGINWDTTSLFQAAGGSDMWPTTWADDGHLYTAWGDGGGFGGDNVTGRVATGIGRITGGPTGLGECQNLLDVNGGACAQSVATWPSAGKIMSLGSIGGTLYAWLNTQDSDTAPPNFRLLWSTDHGATWSQAAWTFDSGQVAPFRFLQVGQGNAGQIGDGYVYLYAASWGGSPGAAAHPGIQLMRVPTAQITSQSAYQYFTSLDASNNPGWSTDPNARNSVGPALDVSYNAGLKRYLGTFTGGPNGATGGMAGLSVFDAPQPWGPWTTVAPYSNWQNAAPDSEWLSSQFIPKWTSSSGLDTWMIFSDYGGATPDRFSDHFNLIHASLVPVASASSPTPTPPTPAPASGSTLGKTSIGRAVDSGDNGAMSGSSVTTGSQPVNVSALSVYIAGTTPAPNNQFEVAIFADAGGKPGARVVASGARTITPSAWNTVPLSVTLQVSTKYWLLYEMNGTDVHQGQLVCDPGVTGDSWWANQSFGSWPATAPVGATSGVATNYRYSMYLSIAPGSGSASPTPSTRATVVAASGKTYTWQSSLQVGSTQYTDRSYAFWGVPSSVAGLRYLRTANDDKLTTGTALLSFSVSQPTTVYVAIDQRLSPRPAWLGSFQDTGMTLQGAGNFEVYAKSFPAGTVTLGGNTGNPTTSMYTVFAR